MNLFEIALLAVVQGVTEFLPVSSSGHLIVANAVLEAMGKEPTKEIIEVSIVLHLGTLLSILVFYCRDILRLFSSDRRALLPILYASIPTAIIGLTIKKSFPDVLENVLLAGCMFPVTAILLILATRKREGDRDYTQMKPWEAVIVGLFQSVALLPGISRSGSTIAAGLLVGQKRASAGVFAFLIAIPAIGGAGLLEIKEAVEVGEFHTPIHLLGIGFLVSFLIGLGALWLLTRFIQKGKLALFAWYLIPLGISVVLWQLIAK